MASSSFVKKLNSQTPTAMDTKIPLRATRQLEELPFDRETLPTNGISATGPLPKKPSQPLTHSHTRFHKIVDEHEDHPLQRHISWLGPLLACMALAIIFAGVLLTASILQRRGDNSIVSFQGGHVYDIQVGGNLAASWEKDQPMNPKTPLPTQLGPYSVLGQPSISVDFINQVLASYKSPAVGKGQALYDMGLKYGIDPAFALAFFMHESTFGTAGEARSSLSLGNLRCIPAADCRDNYAWFPSWEAGFEAWYKLIRNLYIAQWGLTTVDQIIPKYAPNADHNNEAVYIGSLKHYLDTWHAGILRP